MIASREGRESPRPHKRRGRSRSPSRDRGRRRDSSSPFSRGTDTESGEVKEPDSPVRSTAPKELSHRQIHRLADTSLLLDVISKTNYARYSHHITAAPVSKTGLCSIRFEHACHADTLLLLDIILKTDRARYSHYITAASSLCCVTSGLSRPALLTVHSGFDAILKTNYPWCNHCVTAHVSGTGRLCFVLHQV